MHGFHLLNARDNSVLHWIYRESAKSNPKRFSELMQEEAKEFQRLLGTKGVDYRSLKNALVPSADGRQVVFLYNWSNDTSGNYAIAMAERYLPVLRPELKTAVFQGDLLPGRIPIDAFESRLVRTRTDMVDWRTQFAVFFTNLKHGDVSVIDESLRTDPRYNGYVDVTYNWQIRSYLARTIPCLWVIAGRTVLLSHGGDDPFISDDDPVGFDLPKFGYTVVSLVDSYFVAFLDYKIEAPDAPQAADDRILNLAAATGEFIDVESTTIVVPPEKLDKYLLRDENKLRLMTRIGLQDVTPAELGELIRSKVLQSYIYDLRFAQDGTPVFAVAAEFETPEGEMTRRLIALKFDAAANAISLVTMY